MDRLDELNHLSNLEGNLKIIVKSEHGWNKARAGIANLRGKDKLVPLSVRFCSNDMPKEKGKIA